MNKDNLGTRIKENYENISKTKLTRKVPVIIRLDGKAFHSFTKGFNKPFDSVLIDTMQETMKYLCENIQGCVLGYTQSDEITLVLTDYKKLESSAWFDYEVQKMCSISASMATMIFNKLIVEKYNFIYLNTIHNTDEDVINYTQNLFKATQKGAMFDARCFNIPKEEVTNCVYWRQLDASRNSVQMVGRANFSHKELQNKTCDDIKNMLIKQKGINWDDLETYKKYGSCCIKGEHGWVIDKDIPLFLKENRDYIEKLIK